MEEEWDFRGRMGHGAGGTAVCMPREGCGEDNAAQQTVIATPQPRTGSTNQGADASNSCGHGFGEWGLHREASSAGPGHRFLLSRRPAPRDGLQRTFQVQQGALPCGRV